MSESVTTEMAPQVDQSAESVSPQLAQESLPWYGEVEPDLGGYIDNKSWKSPKDVVESYRNLEKLMNTDRSGTVRLPTEDDDEKAVSDFYSKLGRPDDENGYGLSLPEGEDTWVLDWFKGEAHKNGLTKKQAEALFESWNSLLESRNTEATQNLEMKLQADLDDLKREWGQAYDSKIKAGQNAARRFGFTENELSAIEKTIGSKELLKRMSEIGGSLGEHHFERGSGQADFMMTPAQAQAKIAQLKEDKEFAQKYTAGSKAAQEQMKQLMSFAYPDM